jgi:hypothetical protein
MYYFCREEYALTKEVKEIAKWTGVGMFIAICIPSGVVAGYEVIYWLVAGSTDPAGYYVRTALVVVTGIAHGFVAWST